jgi:ATP-binding cassette subfamily F protein 3
MILVTHDRSFMDKVATHTMAIHRRGIRKIAGGTDKLYEQIAQDEETYEKTRVNDERKRKEIEEFIAKFRASAQLQGLVESRKKTLAKMGKKDKLETLRGLDFEFIAKRFYGKYVLEARDLTFGYDPAAPLIRDFSLTIGARDRVFVIGPNGRGKTTLLKLLAGALKPQAGEVTKPWPSRSATGADQRRGPGRPNNVPEEIAGDGALEPAKVRHLAGSMMFETTPP